jgi:hypothetical protein
MGDLKAMGITVQKKFFNAAGEEVDAATAELTELAFTLPKSTNVQASFEAEGLGKRLIKIFKRELQTGDPLFDEHVHIHTETEEATAKLLESEELRAIIEGIVSDGGAVEVDGAFVKVELAGQTEMDAHRTEHFVQALIR